jgi:hypothetical protein
MKGALHILHLTVGRYRYSRRRARRTRWAQRLEQVVPRQDTWASMLHPQDTQVSSRLSDGRSFAVTHAHRPGPFRRERRRNVQDFADDVPANHVPDRAILEAATASRATISSLGVAVIHEPDAF